MCETEKKTYTNKKQKEYLLEFVKTNPKIVANKFENNFTKTQINSLWQEATDELNKLGVKKTKEQWRKVTNFEIVLYKKIIYLNLVRSDRHGQI